MDMTDDSAAIEQDEDDWRRDYDPGQWKVTCDDCGSVLEAGMREARTFAIRPQAECDKCGSYKRTLYLRRDDKGGADTAWPQSVESEGIEE